MTKAFITASEVHHSYGKQKVIQGGDLTVHSGDRTAIVGPNGSGKSTLLRILAGIESPAGGRISRARGTRVAWLPQVTNAGPERRSRSIRLELEWRTGIADARIRMEEETRLLSAGRLDRIEAHGEAVDAWTRLGGADLDARAGRAMESVGIDPDWADRPLGSLSGGQLARINLATLHLSRVDVALLDEPGNHLDAEGLEMLGELIAGSAPAVVIASHDRSLLEGFASQVIELDRGRIRHFRGGWGAYLREKQAARDNAVSDWTRATKERRRLAALEQEISRRARTGEARARRSNETDKFIRHMAIESAQKNTAISGIAKRIDQLEVPEKPWQERLSTLLLDAGQIVHAPRVAVARKLVLARDSWRSRPLDLEISPGERILLAGSNGSGKSSLIATLAGRLQGFSGSIEIPASVRIVELAQQGSIFTEGRGSLVSRFRSLALVSETEARTTLAAMKLGADEVEREPSRLSPGELTRAELALIARTGAACLLLDEPSNHLDIEALEVLEQALEGWKGALVVASHDRSFREAVRFDRELDLGGSSTPM